MTPSRNIWFLVGALGAVALLTAAGYGPLSSGRNYVIKVNSSVQRIPSFGQKCAVTLSNVDVYTKQFPVMTGYACDGGTLLATAGQPVCDNTLTTAVACPSMTFIRDTVPDAICVQGLVGFIPDGGIPVRVEAATGCSNP